MIFKMEQSHPISSYFVFSLPIVDSKPNVQYKKWIRTADLWYRKRLLCQLSHHHCPIPRYILSWNPSPWRRNWLKVTIYLHFEIWIFETENSTSAIMIFCSVTFHENFANILHRTLHALRHVASALHFQHFYVKMFNPKRAATSVTRLGDFWKWKFLVKIFLTTVAQILGHFLGSYKT